MPGPGRTATAAAVAPAPPDPAAPHFGASVPDGQRDPRALDAFERNAGRRLTVVHWYQGWGVVDASRWLQPAWMDAVAARGAIPLISWEPWDFTRGSPSRPPPWAPSCAATTTPTSPAGPGPPAAGAGPSSCDSLTR